MKKRNTNKITERNRLFLHDADDILTLIVCVSMTAALLFSVYLMYAASNRRASEDTAGIEEVFSEPETAGLPLIRIWTDDGERPAFSKAVKPEGLLGGTITDNKYEKGRCTIENVSSMPHFASKMKIKVRGNTTAASAKKDGKLPYKLVLDLPGDLFEDGMTETSFVLLADAGANLKTWLGLHIGELCGIEWTLRSRYVNLELNNEYQGIYLLTEDKDGSSLQGHVGDGGFLIESDAYWWNGDVSFHSDYLSEQMGYTVKYPEITDKTDSRLTEIEAYMEKVAKNILLGDLEDIDLRTFCAWIIAQDILDENDAAGSNIYYYLYDLSGGEESADHLKMGPLWDFDDAFGRNSDPDTENWSYFRYFRSTYFPDLIQNAEFYEMYCSRMDEICASLYDSCSLLLTSLCDELEGQINESREADANRWGKSWTPVRKEAEERLQWLSDRIAWIESQIVPVTKKNGEMEYRRFILDVSDDCETLTIAFRDDGYEQVYFPTWSDENGQDDIVWYEAELNEDQFWAVVVPLSRHHSNGIYQVHVYATKNGEEVFVEGGSFYVEFPAES